MCRSLYVAFARRTPEAFEYWEEQLSGWKKALAAQDGPENLPIPEHFEGLGADSIDEAGLARYSWMRERIYRAVNEPRLFECAEV